jgi:hypothetical protein
LIGFVVDRYWKKMDFVSEDFYVISLVLGTYSSNQVLHCFLKEVTNNH